MKNYMKYGVSAVALVTAVAVAQAQAPERQERGGPQGGSGAIEQQQPGKGGQGSEKRGVQNEPAQGERGKIEQHQGKAAQEHGQTGQEKGKTPREHDRTGEEQGKTDQEHGRANERGTGQQTRQGESRTDADKVQERTDSSRPGEQRDGGKRERVSIRVSPEQKSRIHDVIGRNTAIRRYDRSDIHFGLNVGVRVPDDFLFYDPPAEFLEIDPVFSSYKIIVLDDVILVIDPKTREIVEVIER